MNENCKDSEPVVQKLPIQSIIYDADLQMRAQIDPDHVESLCDAIDAGEALPPIDVFDDDEIDPEIIPRYLIGDGNHRYLAAQKRGLKEISCRVFPGGRPAAQKRALGANAEHNALRRTNADKHKSVIRALELYPKASLRELADICKVTHQTVANTKKEVSKLDTPKKGKAGQVSTIQRDWYQEFLDESYKPFEDKFLDVANSKLWMDPEVPATEKLKTCQQIEEALRRQIDVIKNRAAQIKQELTNAKTTAEPAALPEAAKEHE